MRMSFFIRFFIVLLLISGIFSRSSGAEKVLVLEDLSFLKKIYTILGAKHGLEVVVVQHSKEFIEELAKGIKEGSPYVAVVCDFDLSEVRQLPYDKSGNTLKTGLEAVDEALKQGLFDGVKHFVANSSDWDSNYKMVTTVVDHYGKAHFDISIPDRKVGTLQDFTETFVNKSKVKIAKSESNPFTKALHCKW